MALIVPTQTQLFENRKRSVRLRERRVRGWDRAVSNFQNALTFRFCMQFHIGIRKAENNLCKKREVSGNFRTQECWGVPRPLFFRRARATDREYRRLNRAIQWQISRHRDWQVQ